MGLVVDGRLGRRRGAGLGYLAATFPGEDAIGGIEPLSERDIGESGGNEYSSGASRFTCRACKETYSESAGMGKKG